MTGNHDFSKKLRAKFRFSGLYGTHKHNYRLVSAWRHNDLFPAAIYIFECRICGGAHNTNTFKLWGIK